MLKYFRAMVTGAIAVTTTAAASPDKLVMNAGNILVGYIVPTACGADAISFQPLDGLSTQSVPLANVTTLQAGNYLLDGSETTSKPTTEQVEEVRGFLTTKTRPTGVTKLTLSLAPIIRAICTPAPPPPTPRPTFSGAVKIDGNATFGATVQRSLGGSARVQYNPAVHAPGAITPLLRFASSYGDTIKGPTTIKSSQIDFGQLDVAILLHSHTGGLGPTSLHVIADEYHSFSQGIHLQQDYGVGISQDLWGSLQLEGGLSALREERYKPTPSFSSAAVRLYETDTIYSGKKFVLTEDVEAVLPTQTLRALLVRAGAELTIKLGKTTPPGFSLTLSYGDYYFRNAPPAYKQNYSKLTAGIGYTW